MADSKQAWDRVGQDLGDLGRRVKRHYEEQAGPEQPAGAGRPTPPDRRKVEDALRQLADSLDQAFSALGDAIRDPEFGEQTRKAANSLNDALSATFADVSDRIRSTSDRRKPPPPAG
jgi:hypothetical protein